MRKWIVRLIGISFLFGAITAYVAIVTKKNPTHGFLGFSFSFLSGSSPESMTSQLDIMALIGLCANLYIAYNLLKFKNQGRIWALVVLWLSAFSLVIGLALMSSRNHLSPTEILANFNFLNHSFNLPLLALAGTTLLFYVIQICFLMRKDVKMEFQRQETVEVKPASE